MRYAIIEDGKVVNIIEASEEFVVGLQAVASDTANIGDSWDAGDGFTPAPPPAAVVPASVTRRQARQALLLAGKLASVQPAIDAISNATQRGLVQIEWDDSLSFERHRPSLVALATAIGIDSAGLDALFILAGGLQ